MDIKSLVIASGKTRAEIIGAVGISQSYLSLLERGDRRIGIKHLSKMAAVLGVEPVTLRPDLASLLSSTSVAPLSEAG